MVVCAHSSSRADGGLPFTNSLINFFSYRSALVAKGLRLHFLATHPRDMSPFWHIRPFQPATYHSYSLGTPPDQLLLRRRHHTSSRPGVARLSQPANVSRAPADGSLRTEQGQGRHDLPAAATRAEGCKPRQKAKTPPRYISSRAGGACHERRRRTSTSDCSCSVYRREANQEQWLVISSLTTRRRRYAHPRGLINTRRQSACCVRVISAAEGAVRVRCIASC